MIQAIQKHHFAIEIDVGFAHKHIFLLNSTMIFFLKTDIYNLRESFCNWLLEKRSLTTLLVFVLFKVLLCMVVRFWNFPRHNVTSWREHASHFNV